ncbi:hypothetical protein ATK74_0646 [Propionicimonas paludicola]|uniref:Uncharacterized protein n=1 Tax=Propionicimonas paludicola TaxID=185243 RepID=A0A2A9CPV1_9ACTN|nr:alpha/beta hydrolase [Propionicimonas paludicola]PFG16115.1 hypothetical protein ATK74_0646 [Propionicimonas paludicola]
MGRVYRSAVGCVLAGVVALSMVITGSASPAVASPVPTGPVRPDGARVGAWTVRNLSGDLWKVSWRSPQRLPITSDRPVIVRDATPIGTPIVADGQVVSTVVRSAKAPDPAKLDVVLSGDRISRRGQDVASIRNTAVNFPAGRLLDFDPATAGAYQTTTSDYTGDPVPVKGFEHPVEFVGHVVEPALSENTGPRGIVLFLHGRHSYCYAEADSESGWPCQAPSKEVPSQLGYDYIQQRLASQGYFTVSIRVNGINAQDDMLSDGGADARALLVRKHLDYWAERATEHHLDLDKVVLVGHSRGGEGVARAALQVPLSAPYRVVGAVLLAPTDFSGQAVPYVPTLTVLPYCDGDVYDLQGQRFTDGARDLVSDDTALHSSVMVMGANHNYFNSEWTPGSTAPSWDDWSGDENAVCGEKHPQRLSAPAQRSVGLAYVAGAVQLFTGTDTRNLALLDGERVRVASTGSAVVLSESVGGGRDVRVPGVDTGTTDGTMDADFCRAVSDGNGGHSVCGRGARLADASPHWPSFGEVLPERQALELAWDATGQSGGMLFDKPLDLTGKTLQLRTIIDPARPSLQFGVRLTDADGASADLVPVGGNEQVAFDPTETIARLWAQTLTVDPSSAGIDLAKVVSVELVSISPKGRVWVLDAAAVPAELPAAPNKRIPLVSLGTATELEGNDPNARTVRVPFTLNEKARQRSSFVVRVASYDELQRSDLITVNLAPGQTKGSIPVDVAGNGLPSLDGVSGFSLTGWGVRGVMTDSYLGQLDIKDDDPLPKVSLRVARKTVREGKNATWAFTLSEPFSVDTSVIVEVVRGPKKVRALTGADVTKSWRRAHGVGSTSKPLYKQGLWISGDLAAGSTKLTVSVPIAKDGRKEPREQLTLRFSLPEAGVSLTQTVYVAASR